MRTVAAPGSVARRGALAEAASVTQPRPSSWAATPGILVAALAYLALSVVAYWPVLPLDAARTDTPAPHGDPVQMLWFLAWTPFALLHAHNPFVTHYLDYPQGVNLAANTLVPLLGVLAAPITLSLGPIASLNLLFHLALAGSALAMFLVLRRWTRWWPAAFAGGLLYGFGSYMQTQAHLHLDLSFLVIPPVFLWALDALVFSRRFRPLPGGILVGVLGALQYLVNAELCADMLVLTAIGLVVAALAQGRRAWAAAREALPGLGIAALAFVVLAGYPIAVLLAGPNHLSGPIAPSWAMFREDLLGPFVRLIREPASHPHRAVTYWTNPSGYFGVPLAGLLAVLALVWRRVGVVWLAAAMGVVAFMLALGPRLAVGGTATGIPLPGAAFAHIPGLWNILPMRFTVFEGLFAAIVLAVGLDRSFRRGARWVAGGRHGRPHPHAVRAGLAALAALCLLPVMIHVPLSTQSSNPRSQRSSLTWVAATSSAVTSSLVENVPAGGVVLFVPLADISHDEPMLWQAETSMHFRMVGGYAIIPNRRGTGALQYQPRGALATVVSLAGDKLAASWASGHLSAVRHAQHACMLLPSVVRGYHVDAVVAYKAIGASMRFFAQFASASLGPPTWQAGGVVAWYHPAGTQRPATGCASVLPPSFRRRRHRHRLR